MPGKRRSTRTNNYSNVVEQQKTAVVAQRKAAAVRAIPSGTLEHIVLGEAVFGPAKRDYEKYAAAASNILAKRPAEELAVYGPGRATRRRAQEAAAAGGRRPMAGEPAGDGELDEFAAGRAAERAAADAAAAARLLDEWESHGHQCLDVLEPLVAEDVTLPKSMQEVLMHMVINAEAHTRGGSSGAGAGGGSRGAGSNLAMRAYALLDRLLTAHPPVKLQEGVLVENINLWDPVSCTWTLAAALQQRPGRQAVALSCLAASAHNLLAAAVQAAVRTELPHAEGAPKAGDAGEVLLLKYWVRLMKMDLDVRLEAVRLAGTSPDSRRHLENSLVVRIMQLYPNWSGGSGSKPELVQRLVACVAYAHVAGSRGAWGQQQQQQQAPAALVAAAPLLLCGPGEVGQVAGCLLGMLCEAFAALEAMGMYRKAGAMAPDNDLVQLHGVLRQAVLRDAALADAEHLAVLLGVLPPASTCRLLVCMVAEAAEKRSEGMGVVPLPPALSEVARFFTSPRNGEEPPEFLASTVLRYLLGDDVTWRWATTALRFNSLPHRAGLALAVTQLATATLRHTQQQRQQQQQQQQQGNGAVVEGWEVDEEEAREVALLYLQAAERMARELLVAGGGAGSLPPCVLVARRGADRLAGRQLGEVA